VSVGVEALRGVDGDVVEVQIGAQLDRQRGHADVEAPPGAAEGEQQGLLRVSSRGCRVCSSRAICAASSSLIHHATWN
jgi:hypothetical protein